VSAPSSRQERGPSGRLSPHGIRASASRASRRCHTKGDQMNMALVIERICRGSPSARSSRTIHPLGALEGV
jgi:hypothetical protein